MSAPKSSSFLYKSLDEKSLDENLFSWAIFFNGRKEHTLCCLEATFGSGLRGPFLAVLGEPCSVWDETQDYSD